MEIPMATPLRNPITDSLQDFHDFPCKDPCEMIELQEDFTMEIFQYFTSISPGLFGPI